MAWIGLGILLYPAPPVNAQPAIGKGPPNPVPAAATASKSDAVRPSAERPAGVSEPIKPSLLDVIYLPGPGGELVPVPAGASLQEYLDWLQRKRQPDRAALTPASFHITNLTIDGTADDERATLTARIRVQVIRADEWVRVPLELSEAVLRGFSYKGSGESIADRPEDAGDYAWWFRGRGEHELTLDLTVPVRKQFPRRRLQLSLPPSVVSSLKLRVAHPEVQSTLGERGAVAVRGNGNQSEIEVFGLKEDLDLSWQPVPRKEGAETVVESNTTMTVNLVEGEPLTIEATQRLQALQGLFSELHVQLPDKVELVGIDGVEYLEHRSDPARPQGVIVRLKKPTAGPVELKWTLRGRLPADNVPLTISGFDVREARVQTGFILLQIAGDLQFSRHTEEEQHVRRVNPPDSPQPLRTAAATAAYRFLAQPFKLVFSLRKVEPYVTVEPLLFLGVSAERLELNGVFSYYISRGSMSIVDLFWPGQVDEGWKIDEIGPLELVERWEAKSAGQIRVHLINPARENCQLRVKAHRVVASGTKAGERQTLAMSSPTSRVSGAAASLVEAFLADDVDLDLRGAEGTVLRSLAVAPNRVSPPREMLSLRRLSYRIESGPPQLLIGLTRHSRSIQTETEAAVTASRNELSVRQRIVYDVAYDRLSQLRFRLPAAIRPDQVQLFTATGAPLEAVVRRDDKGADATLICPLDPPRTGRFEIEARYRLPFNATTPAAGDGSRGSGQLTIPLLSADDAPSVATRLHWQDPSGREISLAGEGWTRQSMGEGVQAWTTAGHPSSILLTLSNPTHAALRGTVISRALLRTVIGLDGESETRAQYRLATPLAAISVTFPAGVQPSAFWWNRQRLTANRTGETGNGTTIYELPIPERSTVKDNLLSIDYHATGDRSLRGMGDLHVPAPQFQDEVWLNTALWELGLPGNQHLFQRPDGWSPEYRWSRTDYLFSRTSMFGVDALADWIGEADGPDSFVTGGSGNNYVFSRSGPATAISVRTMSQPAIVLIGAGLALIAGFLLVRIPATRHVISFLALLFGVALVALWFPEPVLLLLQPAAVGLLVAILAAGFDRLLSRRRPTSTVTLVPPSGYLPALPGSSVHRDLVMNIGSDEHTINRPAAARSDFEHDSQVEPSHSSATERSL